LLGRAPRLVAADAAFYILLRHSDRCRYKGDVGMDRWVGLGVIADNVVNIGRAMERQAAP
jgi:hypothetical protein